VPGFIAAEVAGAAAALVVFGWLLPSRAGEVALIAETQTARL
jgi:hypothetical protein